MKTMAKAMLKTKDNNNGNFRVENSIDLLNLGKISRKSIGELVKENPDLLVFPQSFKECGQAIDNQCIFSLLDNKLITHNIMGYIGINDTQLCITSRFDNSGNDYFLHYMLQKVFSVNIFDLKFSTGDEAIWNFLLYLFPYFLNNALRQGLYKTYIRNEYNNMNVKGVIKIKKQLQLNNPFNGKIAYTVREYCFDNAVTQLIRHTIEYIKAIPLGIGVLSHKKTKENTRIILENTPCYNKNNRARIISLNAKPLNHPYFTNYSVLQKICLWILRNRKITFGVNKGKIFGLLFDGAWLWEEYLNEVFLENKIGLEHPKNKEKKGGDNLFINGQPIYPDFIKRIKKGKTAHYVGDAKYKHLDRKGDGIGRDDYYQLITYMYRYECNSGYLFFPYSEEDKLYKRIRKIDGITNNREITEIGLKINQSKLTFKAFKNAMENAEKEMCECFC
jgi:5-methylcytosine-specific restriction endonuclease McrBC regulatory subunit McrC